MRNLKLVKLKEADNGMVVANSWRGGDGQRVMVSVMQDKYVLKIYSTA